jgi:hypothetical protein
MNTEILLEPRFTGERFRANTLPLSLLRDLEALQGIILEIAKDEFRQTNPNRRRIPRGFSEGLTLHLVGSREGSYVAQIGMVNDTDVLPGLDSHTQAARRACERFVNTIAHAQSSSQVVSQPLPSSAWSYIDRFGRGLHDGETIDLVRREGRTVQFTKELRRRLLLTRPGSQMLTDEVEIVVKLGDVRPKEHCITVELADGRIVTAMLTDQQLEELRDVRVGEFGVSWLRASGVASFDRSQQLQRVDEVTNIELLDPLDPSVQLESLRQLREGWLDGQGVALSQDLLARIGTWFDEHLSDDAHLPRLYPTPEGGVEAEWLIGRLDVSIEFNDASGTVDWHAMDLDSGETEEMRIDFDNTEGIVDLGRTMARVIAKKSTNPEAGDGETSP